MGAKVGRPISVGEALSKSVSMLMKTPTLLLPQVIVLVLAIIVDVLSGSFLSFVGVIVTLFSALVSVIVAGAYPSMVQAVIGGSQVSIGDSLRKAFERFWTLLAAAIVVGIIVILGFVALVIPGVIFVTWYAYTVPAIMLENKGTLEGMGASKAFGRDKKWSTFLIFLAIGLVAIVFLGIETGISLAAPLAGRVVYSILSVPLDAWASVVFTYVYITYGPSSLPAAMEPSSFGMAPPAPAESQPGPIIIKETTREIVKIPCRYCGTLVVNTATYCPSCGAALR